jgi:hypothetical protein
MKVTDIVTESNRKSIANEAVPFIPLAAAGARMAAPYIARAGANVMKALRGSPKPQTPSTPSMTRQTYSPATGKTAVPGQSRSMATSFDDPKYWQPPEATKGEKLAGIAGGLTGAGLLGGTLASLPGGKRTTPPASSTTPPAPSTTTPAPAAAAPTARPAPARAPQSQPARPTVGSQLAALSGGEFATRADRTNQEKVDAVLGAGKYRAGSAEANLALRDYYRRSSQGTAGSSAAAPAAATGTPAAVSAPPAASPSSTGAAPSQSSPRPAVSSGSTEPAGSDSGGDSAGFERWVPPRDSSSGGTPVKSGTGLTWTDSSGQPIVTMPEAKDSKDDVVVNEFFSLLQKLTGKGKSSAADANKPAYTGADPIVRKRLGMAPATPDEIGKAYPEQGKFTLHHAAAQPVKGPEGTYWTDSSGQPIAAGADVDIARDELRRAGVDVGESASGNNAQSLAALLKLSGQKH